MQIRTTPIYHFPLANRQKSKSLTTYSAGMTVRNRDLHALLVRIKDGTSLWSGFGTHRWRRVWSIDNMLVSVLSGYCSRITWWVFLDIFLVLFLCCVHSIFIAYERSWVVWYIEMFHSLSSLNTSASFLHNKISLKRMKNLGHQLSQSWGTQELLSSI